jgi:hypothetical protein
MVCEPRMERRLALGATLLSTALFCGGAWYVGTQQQSIPEAVYRAFALEDAAGAWGKCESGWEILLRCDVLRKST